MINDETFNQMLVAQLPRLRGYAMILTRNRAGADDLLQETAFRALRGRSTFTPGTNFCAWIHRILRNEFIDQARQSNRLPISLADVPEHILRRPADAEDRVLMHEVINAVSQLNPDRQEVLLLAAVSELSYEQIGECLECSVGSVKSRLWRARRDLAESLLGADESKTHLVQSRRRPQMMTDHNAVWLGNNQ